ncbi:MAG: hypothetical protein GY701_16345 [Sulfitobacter sp.]|nr:hypothetical protein [Sulfitobacter sp.]MCP4085723.1 hypothetical protein [Actinomycetes bacterium]
MESMTFWDYATILIAVFVGPFAAWGLGMQLQRDEETDANVWYKLQTRKAWVGAVAFYVAVFLFAVLIALGLFDSETQGY